MSPLDRKKANLFVFLSGIFLTNALLAEVIGTKIFSLEKTIGLSPLNWEIFSEQFVSFDLTAGVLLWPVVFVMSDIINEYYGKEGVRKISLLTVGFIIYAFVVFLAVAMVPPADFWVKQHLPMDINKAFHDIFLQGMGIIFGSLVAFLVGQFLDVTAFQWLRKYTGNKNIWLRATGSTLISQLVDSFVVLGIAFYVFGNPRWSITLVFSVGCINYFYKFIAAIIMTPALYLAHYVIENYLGKEESEKLAEEASQSTIL